MCPVQNARDLAGSYLEAFHPDHARLAQGRDTPLADASPDQWASRPPGAPIVRTEICDAILAHRVIELHYDYFVLVVEPYAFGQDRLRQRGREGLPDRRWHRRHGGPGWKLLKVADVTSLRVRDDRFEKRVDYRRNDPDLDSIDCQA